VWAGSIGGLSQAAWQSFWDADALRDDLPSYVVEHLGDADAVSGRLATVAACRPKHPYPGSCLAHA
jgi:hypothetical protein